MAARFSEIPRSTSALIDGEQEEGDETTDADTSLLRDSEETVSKTESVELKERLASKTDDGKVELTDAALIRLAEKIPSKGELRKLCVIGLKMSNYAVQQTINDHPKISEAADELFSKWLKSQDNRTVAHENLCKALETAHLRLFADDPTAEQPVKGSEDTEACQLVKKKKVMEGNLQEQSDIETEETNAIREKFASQKRVYFPKLIKYEELKGKLEKELKELDVISRSFRKIDRHIKDVRKVAKEMEDLLGKVDNMRGEVRNLKKKSEDNMMENGDNIEKFRRERDKSRGELNDAMQKLQILNNSLQSKTEQWKTNVGCTAEEAKTSFKNIQNFIESQIRKMKARHWFLFILISVVYICVITQNNETATETVTETVTTTATAAVTAAKPGLQPESQTGL